MDPEVKRGYESPMLTLPEVGQRLRLAVSTLRQDRAWLTRLRAVKVGGKWLVPVDAVHAILTGKD